MNDPAKSSTMQPWIAATAALRLEKVGEGGPSRYQPHRWIGPGDSHSSPEGAGRQQGHQRPAHQELAEAVLAPSSFTTTRLLAWASTWTDPQLDDNSRATRRLSSVDASSTMMTSTATPSWPTRFGLPGEGTGRS